MSSLARAIVASGVRRRAPAEAVLLAEGAVPDRAIVILEGRVKVTVTEEHGRLALLALRGPGAVLGEHGALTGAPRSATVIAVEPVTFVAIGAERLRRAVDADTDLALDALRLTGERLQHADRKHVEHVGTTTMGRVARRLAEISGPDIPLTQSEIAGLAGASLEATAKALRVLRTAGAIATGRRRIVITDHEALARVGQRHD